MAKCKSKKSKNQIMLICNPESGDARNATAQIGEAVRLLIEQGFEVQVALAQPKKKATKIARRAVREGYRQVVVMGGDGTIEAAARALVGTKTRLGILPKGTFNNVAKSLGIPEDINAACQLLKTGHSQKIDVGEVKNKKGKKFYFLEVASVGLIADLYPEGKDIPQGKPENIIPVIKDLVEYRAPKMIVRLDKDSQLDADSLLLNVSNTPSFGDTLLVAPGASLNDGELDVSFYPKINKPDLVEYLASITGGKRADNPKIERYRAKKITVKTKPKQKIMADGIILGEGSATIRARKGALRVITGDQPGLAKETEITKQPAKETADHRIEQYHTA